MSLDPARPFHISPPFGTWFCARNAYNHLGSFTVEPRQGRLGRIIRTVRPVPSDDGPAWINKIGLRNPGMSTLPGIKSVEGDYPYRPGEIVSLAAVSNKDWAAFEKWLDERLGVVLVEFNPYCPNLDEHASLPSTRQLKRLLTLCPDAIFKLLPSPKSIDDAVKLFDQGVRYVHLSNTIPTPIGGISGKPLMKINLPLVEELAHSLPSLEIIGGGGIYSWDDVITYRNAGARRFAVGSAFFWPPRGRRILRGDPR